jgi:stage III sporulation protein AE
VLRADRVRAEEVWIPEIDTGEAEEILSDRLEGEDFSLGEYIEELLTGEESFSLNSLFSYLWTGVKGEIEKSREKLLSVLVIAVGAAVFTNFSNVFKNNQVADTGFYVAYLLMFSALAASFYEAAKTAEKVLTSLTEFMSALAPAFYMAVTIASSTGTSLLFYQASLVVLWLVDTLLLKIVLPLIHIYFVVHLANHLIEKDLLSKTTELIEEGIGWCLKTLVGVVAGYHFIQGIFTPVADEVKKNTLLKAVEAIPGVGRLAGSLAETVFGAGVLVKNAVGIGGIMALLLLLAGPVVKLFCYFLFYRLGASFIQPVSDRRLLECLMGTAKAAKLLMATVCVGGALFVITIALVMSATNVRM